MVNNQNTRKNIKKNKTRTTRRIQRGGGDLSKYANDAEEIELRDESQFLELPRFTNLKKIKCNNLKVLPNLPDTLVSLICNFNKLTVLPDLPDTLKELNCGFNKLKVLPTLPDTLIELNCSNNQLTVLPTLPDTLVKLLCGGNQLTVLPTLPDKLIQLHCSDNQLTVLPTLPDTLVELYCNNNKLTELPYLPKTLKRLICKGNDITKAQFHTTSSLEVIISDFDDNDSDDDVFVKKCGLNAYKGDDFEEINQYLFNTDIFQQKYKSKLTDKRTRITQKIKRYVKDIDEKINNCGQSFENTTLVYRGMKETDLFKNKTPSESIIIKNYISTSSDIDVAIKFSGENCCIYRIYTDPSVKFIKFSEYSNTIDEENEILLQRNLKMTFIGKNTISNDPLNRLLDKIHEYTTFPSQLDIYISKLGKTTTNNMIIYLTDSYDYLNHETITMMTTQATQQKQNIEDYIIGIQEQYYTPNSKNIKKKIIISDKINYIERTVELGKNKNYPEIILPRYLTLTYIGLDNNNLHTFTATKTKLPDISNKKLIDTINVIDVEVTTNYEHPQELEWNTQKASLGDASVKPSSSIETDSEPDSQAKTEPETDSQPDSEPETETEMEKKIAGTGRVIKKRTRKYRNKKDNTTTKKTGKSRRRTSIRARK